MQRLIADAAKMTEVQHRLGVTVDASSMSFSNIVNAISVMQESMGIAGATAAEAEGTISGSVASMKAAWQNLVIGFADENANIEVLLDEFLTSVEVVAGNILPVVERVLSALFATLEKNAPDMIVSGVKLLGKLAVGLIQAIPDVVASIPEIVMSIGAGFAEALPEFKEIGVAIVEGIWEGIKSLGNWLGSKVSGFFGSIVDGVKDMLGIHSPSRVFAGIGENMAQGVGAGWDKEFDSIRDGIEGSVNFSTGTTKASSAGMGGMASDSREVVINFTNELDGAVLSRKTYRYNLRESELRGGSLVEVYA